MLHDALHRLHLIDRSGGGGFLPSEEVAQEDCLFLLIHHPFPLLKLLVTAQSCGYLKVCDSLRVPCVGNTILPPCKLPIVGQELIDFDWLEGFIVQTDGISCNIPHTDASDGAHLCAEIPPQQIFAQAHTLENLRSTIRADG